MTERSGVSFSHAPSKVAGTGHLVWAAALVLLVAQTVEAVGARSSESITSQGAPTSIIKVFSVGDSDGSHPFRRFRGFVADAVHPGVGVLTVTADEMEALQVEPPSVFGHSDLVATNMFPSSFDRVGVMMASFTQVLNYVSDVSDFRPNDLSPATYSYGLLAGVAATAPGAPPQLNAGNTYRNTGSGDFKNPAVDFFTESAVWTRGDGDRLLLTWVNTDGREVPTEFVYVDDLLHVTGSADFLTSAHGPMEAEVVELMLVSTNIAR